MVKHTALNIYFSCRIVSVRPTVSITCTYIIHLILVLVISLIRIEAQVSLV